jgi:hypothetical protein
MPSVRESGEAVDIEYSLVYSPVHFGVMPPLVSISSHLGTFKLDFCKSVLTKCLKLYVITNLNKSVKNFERITYQILDIL